MKKLISTFLLICLIIPFVGTVSWLNHHKKMVRRQVKHLIIAGIDKNELVIFSFTFEETKTQLNWKHTKEFEYKNQMYDIVEVDTTENTINYWCWWDNKETKLNKQLNSLLTIFLGNDTQNKETKTRFANFYKTLCYASPTQWKALSVEPNTSLNICYFVDDTTLQIQPPTPPPNYLYYF